MSGASDVMAGLNLFFGLPGEITSLHLKRSIDLKGELMKIHFGKWGILAVSVLFGSVFLLASARAAAKERSFTVRRAEIPAKLAQIRARADAAGGKDLSLALLLGAQNKDARLVASTVLVYQEYPKERKLGVLLAAAIRFNERLEVLERVSDDTLQKTLLQAPAEMEGIEGMFSTIDTLASMPPAQFQKAVADAKRDMVGRDFVRKSTEQTVKRTFNQTSRADRD